MAGGGKDRGELDPHGGGQRKVASKALAIS